MEPDHSHGVASGFVSLPGLDVVSWYHEAGLNLQLTVMTSVMTWYMLDDHLISHGCH